VSIGGFAWGRWHAFLGLQQRLLLGLGQPYQPIFSATFRLITRLTGLAVRRWRGRDLATANPMTRSLVESLPDAHQLDQVAMAHIFRAMRHHVDMRAHLGEIAAPVLVVTGDHDAFVPSYHAQAIAEGVPDGTLVTVPGGHLALLETPDVVQPAILDWLDAHPGPR
jgi:3-oxoadipate enol-lactonase/4-carboxymuconolactone decarboxylase